MFVVQIVLFSDNSSLAYAQEDNIYYAKVQSVGVNLCSMPNENSSLFEIPYSYFVKVESTIDDYYKVSYNAISGYVKKDKVTLMNGEPKNPYAQATFKVFLPYSLFESPNQTSTEKAKITSSSIITYYGTKIGQQVSSRSNLWYYSSIIENNQTYYGYVYSEVADYLSTISINTETFEVVKDNIFDSSPEFSSLSTGTKIILIVAISFPSLLILYFLIKPSKIMQITKSKQTLKKERKKIQHGDYFEFDESQL